MSLHMTSQAKARPDFQGIIVTPSTCFPSDRKRPGGSTMAGTSMEARDNNIFEHLCCLLPAAAYSYLICISSILTVSLVGVIVFKLS